MKYVKKLSVTTLAVAVMAMTNQANAAKTDVSYKGLLVSSKSLLLLAKEATKGIEEPKRIFKGLEVGHHQEITPSARKLMKEAELIFWYGDEIEAGLAKTLEGKKNAVELLEIKAFDLHKPRPLNPEHKENHDDEHAHKENKHEHHHEEKHGEHHEHHEGKHHDAKKHEEHDDDSHDEGHGDHHEGHEHHHHTLDPHIWLDPIRAIRIVNAIAEGRAAQYPKQASKYRKNSKEFAKKMRAIGKENQGKQKIPYIAFHDAYRYSEKTLNMKHLASLTTEPEHPIKPSNMMYALKTVKKSKQKVCFFSENIDVQKKIPRLMNYITVVNIDPKLNKYNSYIEAWQDINKELNKCRK